MRWPGGLNQGDVALGGHLVIARDGVGYHQGTVGCSHNHPMAPRTDAHNREFPGMPYEREKPWLRPSGPSTPGLAPPAPSTPGFALPAHVPGPGLFVRDIFQTPRDAGRAPWEGRAGREALPCRDPSVPHTPQARTEGVRPGGRALGSGLWSGRTVPSSALKAVPVGS